MANKMNAKDAVSAKLAECTATIDGNRYNLFNMIDFEATFNKETADVPILGKSGAGHKSVSWSGEWSGTMHYNSPIFREMMSKFKDTGEDVLFTITITNDDPMSASGKQTVVFLNCTINEGILAKFDASSDDVLDEEVSGTFEDFQIKTPFNLLDGMTL